MRDANRIVYHIHYPKGTTYGGPLESQTALCADLLVCSLITLYIVLATPFNYIYVPNIVREGDTRGFILCWAATRATQLMCVTIIMPTRCASNSEPANNIMYRPVYTACIAVCASPHQLGLYHAYRQRRIQLKLSTVATHLYCMYAVRCV